MLFINTFMYLSNNIFIQLLVRGCKVNSPAENEAQTEPDHKQTHEKPGIQRNPYERENKDTDSNK